VADTALDRQGRRVALKVLLGSSENATQRFVREMQLTARLQHPSIVTLYEAGRWRSGEPFFAMKLVEGRSLRDELAELPTLKQRLSLVPRLIAVTDALAYAHDRGVIHRDLKPGNILVGAFGVTVVIDWGLAKLRGAAVAVALGLPTLGAIAATISVQRIVRERNRAEIQEQVATTHSAAAEHLVEFLMVLAIGVEEGTARTNASPPPPLSRQKGVDTGYARSQADPHAVAGPRATGPDTSPDESHSGSLRAPEASAFGISAWLVGNSGALPEPGLGLALAHRFEAFEMRAGVEFLPSQAVSATPEVELTGELDALTLSALVCTEPWDSHRTTGAVGVSLCTGWAVARWSGSAVSTASAWWTGPRAEVGFAWPIPELDARVARSSSTRRPDLRRARHHRRARHPRLRGNRTAFAAALPN
jgi:serine/threonine protein kinase